MVIKADVIGIHNLDYTNKAGNHVTGRNIYFTFEDQYTDGLRCGSVYLSDRGSSPILIPGDVIRVAVGRNYCDFIEKV